MHPDSSLTERLHLPGEEATVDLGRRIASKARPGDLLFLEGDLGAGKTTFARGFLAGRGWDGPVRSPTYPIVRTYQTPTGTVHHLDLYRLGGVEEALGIDLDEVLCGNGIALVEWPDRLEDRFRPSWRVHLDQADTDSRQATVESNPAGP